MSRFTFWKGFADAAAGVILLTKPELIYHSAVAKALSRLSGLRVPNPHPTAEGEISSQHAVAIMVLAVGLAHMRAASERKALPAFVLMSALWSAFSLFTVVLKPHRATSALLFSGIDQAVLAGIMVWRTGMGWREILGIGAEVKSKSL